MNIAGTDTRTQVQPATRAIVRPLDFQRALRDNRSLPTRARVWLWALSTHGTRNTWAAHIQEETGLSKNYVTAAKREAMAEGWAIQTQSGHGNRSRVVDAFDLVIPIGSQTSGAKKGLWVPNEVDNPTTLGPNPRDTDAFKGIDASNDSVVARTPSAPPSSPPPNRDRMRSSSRTGAFTNASRRRARSRPAAVPPATDPGRLPPAPGAVKTWRQIRVEYFSAMKWGSWPGDAKERHAKAYKLTADWTDEQLEAAIREAVSG